ncbi:MAG: hypothetical protein HZB38_11165 [Planctomycetes bacterium]|nr:hypothetical protein [Planctomycetota bacterium]
MKGANHCAKKTKQLLKTLRGEFGKINKPTIGDPATQLILGIFSRDAQESKAREALETLRAMVVDYNDLRVIPHSELAAAIGDYPDVRLKCEDLNRALNRIFALEHSVTLDHLADKSKADVARYLDAIPGLEPYTRARIRLLGLGAHAIPLDEAMWNYAKQQELVDPKCPLDVAQTFLERQIEAEDAIEFVALLRKQAWAECGSLVRKGAVERIRSVPPDRTTRNMLQMVAQGGTIEVPEPQFEEPELSTGEEEAAAKSEHEEESKPATKKGPQSKKAAKTGKPNAAATKHAPRKSDERRANKKAAAARSK